MARNATFRGANLQYVAAPTSLTTLTDVTVSSAANLDRLQYSSSAGKWVDVAALTTPQIEDSSADHQYAFAVSELAADRTVTLPLLTGDDTFVFNAFAATLTNKTLTSPVLNTGVSGSAVLDQDDMSGNSATQLATQQSIKAYVDAQVATEDTLSELNDTTISGPASNDVLQYSGSAWVDRTYAEAGLVSLTGSETLTNKTLTSPVLNGGALTALTDLDMTSGDKTILDTIGANTLTIGASDTTVTIPGSLTVTGGTTTVSTTNTLIADKLITLNDGGAAASGTAVGIEVEEDDAVTGYIKTAADRAGWELKAPSTAGVLSIDPSANSNTLAFGGSGKTFTISETATIDQDLATTANVTFANLTATGNVALGNAASDTVTVTGTIQGASPLVFEGGSANGYETTLAITDPTADRTWTLPDATDTFVGKATTDSLSNKTLASPVITTGDINTPDIDGGTVDAITSLTIANNVDVGSYTVRASGFLADGLTAGQVVYTGTNGVLASEAALAYNASTNTLTATNIAGTLTTAAQTAITSVGALDGGSITSGFGTIDNGSSAITTTGLISGGSLDIDNVLINGTTIGHTDDTDLLTLTSGLVTVAGEISTTTLDIGGTNVTSTAAELNILDGVTSTAAELNILDGVTSTAAELNILDGVTSTAAELNVMDGVTSTAAELNLVDGSSANSVVNSKAVIYGSSGELAGTLSTAAQTNVTSVGALDAGSITSGFGNIDNGSSTFNTGAATVDSLDCSNGSLSNVGASGNDWTNTTFTHSGDGLSSVTRTTSASGAATTFGWTVMHETTQNMEAGFAVALAFRLKDNTSAASNMARIDGAWNGADDTGKMTMYAYDSGSATASFDVLPGGIDMLNNTILNVGGSGNDWTDTTFTHSGTGLSLMERETDSTGSITFAWTLTHKSTGDAGNGFGPALAFRISDTGVSQSNIGRIEFIRADNSDSTGDFQVVPYVGGSANTALKLTSAGVLSVDLSGSGSAAQVDLFDRHDDATELQRFAYSGEGIEDVVPGITVEQRLANRERMVEMGIIMPVAGAASGYHMRIQPLTRLLAGGIYQNRHRMDSQYEELSKRLEAIGA